MTASEPPQPRAPEASPLARWWQRTAKPILGGGFGGFLLTMAVMAVLEACGVPFEGPREAAWADSVIALTWFGSSFALYYLLRLRAMGLPWPKLPHAAKQQASAAQPSGPQERTIADQVRRIEAKARRLRRQADAAGAPYGELATMAPELAAQAQQLADRIRTLQSVSLTMATDGPDPVPAPPPGASGPEGEMLRNEYEAVEATRRRLQDLLQANRLQQQLCFTRLQRIGDLLDAAWVEVSQPVELLSEARTGTGIVQEVETELLAARDALSEVERSEQQEA